jgi:uncharacterized lipoprotein YehR (DUF1307 family)
MRLDDSLKQYIGKCIKFDLQRMHKERAPKTLPSILAKYYYITGIKQADQKMVTFSGVRFAENLTSEDEYADSMIMYRDYQFNELHEMRPQDYVRVITLIFK